MLSKYLRDNLLLDRRLLLLLQEILVLLVLLVRNKNTRPMLPSCHPIVPPVLHYFLDLLFSSCKRVLMDTTIPELKDHFSHHQGPRHRAMISLDPRTWQGLPLRSHPGTVFDGTSGRVDNPSATR